MNILKFKERFPDRESVSSFLKPNEVQEGVVCKKCRSATEKGFTALELQRPTGSTRYQTAFDLCQKIRVIMGKPEDFVEFILFNYPP